MADIGFGVPPNVCLGSDSHRPTIHRPHRWPPTQATREPRAPTHPRCFREPYPRGPRFYYSRRCSDNVPTPASGVRQDIILLMLTRPTVGDLAAMKQFD